MRICLMGQEKKSPLSASKGIRIKRVDFKEMQGLSPGTKKTVRNDEVSVSSRSP